MKTRGSSIKFSHFSEKHYICAPPGYLSYKHNHSSVKCETLCEGYEVPGVMNPGRLAYGQKHTLSHALHYSIVIDG